MSEQELSSFEWFDSHCHLQEKYLSSTDDQRMEGQGVQVLPELIRAYEAGVNKMICVGTNVKTSIEAIALVESIRDDSASNGSTLGGRIQLWASAGLHPHDAVDGVDDLIALVDRVTMRDKNLKGAGPLVAVGECGLDYHYDHSPRSVQREVFAAQIALANHHSLGLVIHARDAWDDLFDILKSQGVPERTVLHCFTGGPEELRRCLDFGMYVSFSGVVTFKNANEVRDAALICPRDRLLIETDSPFLAPVPHRGRVNEPALVSVVGSSLATLRGVTVQDLAHSTYNSAMAMFGL